MILNQFLHMMKNNRNTRDYLVWTAGNGNTMHEMCIPQTAPHA